MARPERLVLVTGTGTEVGKTWVCSALLRELRGRGLTVAARKPAQSFDVDAGGAALDGPTDAEVLAAASGEDALSVCTPGRSYGLAMAPPMAAEVLGLPVFSVADLVDELQWPEEQVEVGVVELAGGVRSPQAADGDVTGVATVLRPDLTVLVADAGLGTLNAVCLSMDALRTVPGDGSPGESVVVLNRFDPGCELHRLNRGWLADRDGHRIVALPGEEAVLAGLVIGSPAPASDLVRHRPGLV